MRVLQATQKLRPPAEASTYRALLAALETAYQNLRTCSANIQALLLEMNTSLAEAERRARVARTAEAYEIARTECMIAAANLNAFVIAEMVSSSPAVQAEAPE